MAEIEVINETRDAAWPSFKVKVNGEFIKTKKNVFCNYKSEEAAIKAARKKLKKQK